MGRDNVEKVLQKNPDRWFTYKELADIIGISVYSVGRTVRKNSGVFIETQRQPDKSNLLVRYKNED